MRLKVNLEKGLVPNPWARKQGSSQKGEVSQAEATGCVMRTEGLSGGKRRDSVKEGKKRG